MTPVLMFFRDAVSKGPFDIFFSLPFAKGRFLDNLHQIRLIPKSMIKSIF